MNNNVATVCGVKTVEVLPILSYRISLRGFDKIFNMHQIGSVQAITGPIQIQLHCTTSYNV